MGRTPTQTSRTARLWLPPRPVATPTGERGLVTGRRSARSCPLPAFVEREVERRPSIHFAFRPDASAVTADDALYGRQPDAGPLEFIHRMQPLKCAEELRRVG